MRAPLIAAIVLALSCGGSDPTNFTQVASSGDLSTSFNGTWRGATVLALQGVAPFSASGQLVVSVNGHSATVSELCPDGSGSATATGGGTNATWSGSLHCPAVAFSDCSSVVLTYESGSLTLTNNSTALTVQGAGSATGCGITRSMAVTFTGSK